MSESYLDIAERNLGVAGSILNNYPTNAVESMCQAIEKALKEYIVSQPVTPDTLRVLHIHNLKALYKFTNLDNYSMYISLLGELNDGFFLTRYPGDEHITFTAEEATELYNQAAILFDVIKSEIKIAKEKLLTDILESTLGTTREF